MPLYGSRPVKLIPHPADLDPKTKVFPIRFTDEIFTEYDAYCQRLDFYRLPKFSCKYTGKSGLNYEHALEHEQRIKATISTDIPSEYHSLIFNEIQYSQLRLTELVNTIHSKVEAKFQDMNQAQTMTTVPVPESGVKSNSLDIDTDTDTNTNTSNQNEFKNAVRSPGTNTTSPTSKKSKGSKGQKVVKCPVKKHQIRTQIRVAATQEYWKGAPWILDPEIAAKHCISTEMPPDVMEAVTEYRAKQEAKHKKKTPKPRVKKEKSPKPVKPDTMIHDMTIMHTKSLKYPVDDQLLLMFDKMENEKLVQYDQFWKMLEQIGCQRLTTDDDLGDESPSNLAFYDLNHFYDENVEVERGDSDSTLQSQHRQLNDLFSRIWQCWSLVAVYHQELGLSPFPISFLIDSLFYQKRCVLLDEVQCALLEMIRKHCMDAVEERMDQRRQHRRRLRIARKKSRKKTEKAKLKRIRDAERKKNGKEEMDEDSESESASESEEEDDSEISDESEEELTESEDEEMEMEPMWETTIFTESPLTMFKLDVLREYLRHRCGRHIDTDTAGDDADAMDVDVVDIDGNGQNGDGDDDKMESLLPSFEYSLSDEIWDKLSSLRSYPALPIEDKLDILQILIDDAMSTTVMAQWTRCRVERYQTLKYDIKAMDEEYSAMVKEEKSMLRTFRTRWLEKRKEVYPKKESKRSQNGKKSKDGGSAASTPGPSAGGSVASSISPSQSPNKENKASRANSRSRSTSQKVAAEPLQTAQPLQSVEEAPRRRSSSRREELLRKKREKEAERLRKEQEMAEEKERKRMEKIQREKEKEIESQRQEVQRLEEAYKAHRESMNERCRAKKEENIRNKEKLKAQCRTHIEALGSDRYSC